MTPPALPPLPPEEADLLAAEYALGALEAAERAAAEARLAADPAFAAAVAAWAARLAPLDAAYRAVEAPDLLPAIERRLFAGAPVRRGRDRLAGAIAGLAVVAGLAVAAVLLGPAEPPPRTATLSGETAIAFAAAFDGRMLTLRRIAGGAAGAGHDHQLWLIAGGAAPVSLGLFRGLTLARPLAAIPPGALLAVSLEPAGGSPTGAPTGPLLATGTFG
jgi:anti-sigma-K factor RskA